MTNALEVRNLTKKYEGFTLDNLSFSLPTGCIMGFIGENGAGKTTTIKLILGLIAKNGGEVSVLGQNAESAGANIREHIGVVLDESGFPENLSLNDIGRIMPSIFRTWDGGRFRSLAARLALPERKKIKDFSRGMRMKLSIAIALSHDSRILILDEATSGLDPVVRDEMLDVFLDFIQDEGHSVFISSHIISDLEKICDYVTLIHEGRIVFSREKDELLSKYAVVKCSVEEYKRLPASHVVGTRKSSFTTEALMEARYVPKGIFSEKATIEDIMLYFIKGEKK